ncbi:MAG: hypothetical protein ACYDAA_19335 [Syntrophales bacterium]
MPVTQNDGAHHPSTVVRPDAVLIGDVIAGPHCYCRPCACLRDDYGQSQ